MVFTQFDVKDVRIGKAVVKQPTYFLKVLVGNSNVRFHSFIFLHYKIHFSKVNHLQNGKQTFIYLQYIHRKNSLYGATICKREF